MMMRSPTGKQGRESVFQAERTACAKPGVGESVAYLKYGKDTGTDRSRVGG